MVYDYFEYAMDLRLCTELRFGDEEATSSGGRWRREGLETACAETSLSRGKFRFLSTRLWHL